MRTTEEQRERLRGTTLEVVGADASAEVRELSPAEALDALQQRFGVAVDPSDRTELEALLT
jgi:hypothetical protein